MPSCVFKPCPHLGLRSRVGLASVREPPLLSTRNILSRSVEQVQSGGLMFCSGCGSALIQGQPVCAQCGRPVAPVVPPVPGFQFQLESYAGKVRALSLVWLIYAAFSLLVGLAGLTVAHQFFSNHFGNWGHGPWSDGSGPPEW